MAVEANSYSNFICNNLSKLEEWLNFNADYKSVSTIFFVTTESRQATLIISDTDS